jgi:hypothetical protein
MIQISWTIEKFEMCLEKKLSAVVARMEKKDACAKKFSFSRTERFVDAGAQTRPFLAM